MVAHTCNLCSKEVETGLMMNSGPALAAGCLKDACATQGDGVSKPNKLYTTSRKIWGKSDPVGSGWPSLATYLCYLLIWVLSFRYISLLKYIPNSKALAGSHHSKHGSWSQSSPHHLGQIQKIHFELNFPHLLKEGFEDNWAPVCHVITWPQVLKFWSPET